MFYRRRLPHWLPDPEAESLIFVTWRLAGSVPAGASRGLSGGKAFAALDRETDRALLGPVWLADARVAEIIKSAFLRGERERQFYILQAWVIMPNHVHLLIQPKVALGVITRWLKGSTARHANLILRRTGEVFWKDESFDHRVRNHGEMQRIIRYIEYNPVKAGFVSEPGEWRWSSAAWAGENACPTSAT